MIMNLTVSLTSSYAGIPTLIIMDENWKVISINGRGAVAADPEGKVIKFYKIFIVNEFSSYNLFC